MRYLVIAFCLLAFVSCSGKPYKNPVVKALMNADFVQDHGDESIVCAGYDNDYTFVGYDTDGDMVFDYLQYYECPDNRLPVVMTVPGGYKLNHTGCVKREIR